MAVRPIDGNELVDTLKQIVSDYTSHGIYPSAFPIYPDDRIFRWSMLGDELNYRWF